MGALSVVVLHVPSKKPVQVATAEHDREIQDLVANGANEPLGKRVGLGRLDGSLDHPAPLPTSSMSRADTFRSWRIGIRTRNAEWQRLIGEDPGATAGRMTLIGGSARLRPRERPGQLRIRSRWPQGAPASIRHLRAHVRWRWPSWSYSWLMHRTSRHPPFGNWRVLLSGATSSALQAKLAVRGT